MSNAMKMEFRALQIDGASVGWMQSTEVTRRHFRAWPGATAAPQPPGIDKPAVRLTYAQAVAYCEWVTATLDDGFRYRLPTDREWTAACGAGRVGHRFWWGEDESVAGEYANVPDLSARRRFEGARIFDTDDGYPRIAPVAQFKPNPLGLYDMIGNVSEFVSDGGWLAVPSEWADRGFHLTRGGSWHVTAPPACDARGYLRTGQSATTVGFRLFAAKER